VKKIINDPFEVVDEMLEGILLAHPGHLQRTGETGRALVRRGAPVPGKVGIATGGGSGHLPVFLGYVGPGLADGVAVGNVFSSPGPQPMLDCIRAVDAGKGVLLLFGNYQGDIMNFEAAAEMARADGIDVRIAIVNDDVPSAPRERIAERRGVAGLFYAYKLVGARADEAVSLDELERTAREVIRNTRSVGVALAPCTVPAAGRPTFEIADDEMEFGMGIHGEPGTERSRLKSADAIAAAMVETLLADLPFVAGDEVSVLVNGLGATPPTELYVLYRRVHALLLEHGLRIDRSFVGEYATSLEMAGCSLTLLKLDDERKRLLHAPAFSPFLLQKS